MIRLLDRFVNSYPKRIILLAITALIAIACSCFYNIMMSKALIGLSNPQDLFTLANLPSAYNTFLGRFLIHVLASTMQGMDYIFAFFTSFSFHQVYYLTIIVLLFFSKKDKLEKKLFYSLLGGFMILVVSYLVCGYFGYLAYNATTTLKAVNLLSQLGWIFLVVNLTLLLGCIVSVFLLIYHDYFNCFIIKLKKTSV